MLTKAQIVAQFEKDFERCKQQLGNVHKDYKEDKEFFLLDKQWSKAEQDARNPQGQPPRPTLTVNRMRQFLMQVINDHKQARMGIKVSPGGGEEDVELAQIRQGIVRSIERNNGGHAAYGQAKTDQVAGGFGAWRLYADYISKTSHEQEPKYLPIWDGTKLYWPIKDCMEADYSDMDCAIIQEDWSDHKFKQKFGKDAAEFLNSEQNPYGAWGGTAPTVTEYYFRREIPETLVRTLEGKDVYLSDLKKQAEEAGLQVEDLLATDEAGERIERDTERCEIWWCKLAGKEVIGKPVKLPGQWIPVFIANGRKVVVNGEHHLWSLGRPAKDTQRSHNYAASAEMERLALSPKAPFITPVGSIPVTEKRKWETLNTGNHPYVQFHAYDPTTKQPLPPPKRTDPIQSDPGFLNLKQSTVDEMKAVLGMYDPSLGKQGNAVSGVAINAQTRQGDNATFDFADHMAIAMRHCGRVLNEWIPAYIDTPRQVQMIGDDDREKVIRVNEEAQDEKGNPYAYWMDKGKFNIDITMGPSAATKRQETVESMKEFYAAYPPAAAATGHLFAKEQDWRYADEFSKILKRLANQQFPGVIEPEPGEEQKQQQIPPEVQQQMQQMQEALQQMQPEMQKLQQAAQQANQKAAQVSIENQAIKAQKDIETQKVRIDEFNAITNRLKVVNDSQLSQHELQMKTMAEMGKLDIASQKMRQDAQMKQADGAAKVQMHREGLKAKTSAQQGRKPTGASPGKPATAKAQK